MSDPAPELRFGTGGPPGTEFLPPDLPPEDAATYVELARFVLSAALYPSTLPDDPLPAPLELALAILANTAWHLSQTEQAGALPVLSESIGSYSYRLAQPASPEQALLLGDGLLNLIGPWLPTSKRTVYDVATPAAHAPAGWPLDWFQRDLDQPWVMEHYQ